MKSMLEFYGRAGNEQGVGESHVRARIFSEWVGTGKDVLDVGCFDGALGADLIAAGNRVWGVEIAADRVAQARARGLEVAQCDVSSQAMPFDDEFFDVIVLGEIIEHVFDTDGLLREVRAKLRADGLLILSTPNLASLGRRWLLLTGRNPFCEFSTDEPVSGCTPVGHIRYFVENDLRVLLGKHGFHVECLTSDALNLGLCTSRCLARLFPSLSWRFLVRARKVTCVDGVGATEGGHARESSS